MRERLAAAHAWRGTQRALVRLDPSGPTIFIKESDMLKRMSVVICGAAVVAMTAGYAAAQTATQDAKEKAQASASKTAGVVTDAEITSAVKTKLLADKTVGGSKIDVDT